MTKEFYKAQMVTAVLHYSFKIMTVAASALSIYLGYYLYIQGVTGEASLIVGAKDFEGQLINAAPGLFFAIGGLGTLGYSIHKSAKVFIPYPENTNDGK